MARFKPNMKETRHGRYRGADPQARSHSDALAYYRTRASQPKPAAAFDAEWADLSRAERDARASAGAGAVERDRGQWSAIQQYTSWSSIATVTTFKRSAAIWTGIDSAPKRPELENAGLTVGEIIAHRVWRITPDRKLKSGYRDDVWEPGVPVCGDPEAADNHGIHGLKPGDRGIAEAVGHYGPNGFMAMMNHMNALFWIGKQTPPARDIGVAVGTVRLYGTVIEHARGYRAQYAMVESIDRIEDCKLPEAERAALLTHLRASYCPEAA